MRRKQGILKPGEPALVKEDIQIIDVSDYQPPRIPSKTWRECIKKIWEVDPLLPTLRWSNENSKFYHRRSCNKTDTETSWPLAAKTLKISSIPA